MNNELDIMRENLSKISATWFVSFCYFYNYDHSYQEWRNIKTYQSRMGTFKRTQNLHKLWLEKVLEMNDLKLNTNKIGVTAQQTKNMAKKFLAIDMFK